MEHRAHTPVVRLTAKGVVIKVRGNVVTSSQIRTGTLIFSEVKTVLRGRGCHRSLIAPCQLFYDSFSTNVAFPHM